MTGILIFDDSLDPARLAGVEFEGERMDLFPLTGNWRLLREVCRFFQRAGISVVEIVDTARLVETETAVLAERLAGWSARLGEEKIQGRSIRNWLLSPDGGVSGYWFGATSEINPLKTGRFLQLAQAHAFKRQLGTAHYEVCFAALGDRYLRRSVVQLGLRHGSRAIDIKVRSTHHGVQSRLKTSCDQGGLVGQLVLGMATWMRFLYWRFLVGRAVLQGSPGRRNREQLMFVTYFPYLDREAAQLGRFHNLYAGPLQDLFQEIGLGVIWLLVFVTIEGKSFKEAALLKRRLTSEGECLHFVEEFLSYRSIFQVLAGWIRQAGRARWLARRMREEVLSEGLSDRACLPILHQVWWQSVAGGDGVKGLLYYEAFKAAFAAFPNIRQCLYYCEMQGWEMALNAASRRVNPVLRTIGYQHTTIPRYFFPYFQSSCDVADGKDAANPPAPNILACNGSVGLRLLAEGGHPRLVMVEAVRQLHLWPLITSPPSDRDKRPTLLVAGSIDRQETKAMLSLLAAAFPRCEGLQIWLKGHPSLPMEKVLETLEVDPDEAGYEVKYGSISDHLAATWAVLVPTSTVAIEALAYGCEVIVPYFSNSLPLSPLLGFERYYHRVYTPEDLQRVVRDVFTGRRKIGADEKKSFVGDYWCLDLPLSRWSALLTQRGGDRVAKDAPSLAG